MPKESTKLQSWQIFHYARKHLGRSVLYGIFGKRHARTVDHWSQDPRFTDKEEKAFDPIQGVKDLLSILDDHGHCGVVRSCLSYLSAETSCAASNTEDIVEPLPTIGEELLADFRAVAKLQSVIELDKGIEAVLAAKREAISEIERTVALYRKGQQ